MEAGEAEVFETEASVPLDGTNLCCINNYGSIGSVLRIEVSWSVSEGWLHASDIDQNVVMQGHADI